ncbi:hypothetical protein NMSP_0477 [Candidatus Nitrosomarinus catalina]|uniref:Uncharacterized protein n=1 Tax=Candidatus Nitrosomarinus catalinensis TaxID=1898749 RepID=A0A2Z2HS33_9ARCH|nr:hypothetical protein [Candidatus Nitrosomarinus catalina]ARS64100.1 hypothetical protein NMSP_0477 [Candidatus Nitrosomarinus catalina]
MTDIIWGNGQKIISTDSFQINVTHRKDGNSDEYPDSVKIIISGVDLPGLSDNKSDWTVENLQSVIVNAFLKCEIDSKTPEGHLIAKVSHSGAAGY